MAGFEQGWVQNETVDRPATTKHDAHYYAVADKEAASLEPHRGIGNRMKTKATMSNDGAQIEANAEGQANHHESDAEDDDAYASSWGKIENRIRDWTRSTAKMS